MTRYLCDCCIILLALLYISTTAFASQTLTLSLEEPELSASVSKPPVEKPVNSATPKQEPPKENTVTIGRVGMVSVASATIFTAKSYKSKKYAVVKSDTPLAVVKEEGNWLGVLMTNGALGWISTSSVKMTGYELVTQKKDIARGSLVSRGGDPERGSWAERLINAALKYSGVRYVYGGTNPDSGMDCSAFVRMVFKQFGVSLPRTAREQAQIGATVPVDQLEPGDRLYFSCKNSYIDHCGIYAGNGYFVHCSASKKGVAVDSLASDFYWRSLTVAKRS